MFQGQRCKGESSIERESFSRLGQLCSVVKERSDIVNKTHCLIANLLKNLPTYLTLVYQQVLYSFLLLLFLL